MPQLRSGYEMLQEAKETIYTLKAELADLQAKIEKALTIAERQQREGYWDDYDYGNQDGYNEAREDFRAILLPADYEKYVVPKTPSEAGMKWGEKRLQSLGLLPSNPDSKEG
jgi:flagellar biosynthesis/type III secretory pathway protein FliH